MQLRDLANERKRFGYRRLFVLLRQSGEPSGINRIYRLYREEGLTVLGWRDTPVDGDAIGRVARASQPYIQQIFVGRGRGMNEDTLERKLYVARKRAEADALFHRVGITFAVYGENEGTERLIPFDIVPRILPAAEWLRLEQGLKQRVRALNAFLADVYHEQREFGNLIEKFEKNIGQVGLIHIADVPGRHEPGTGEINYLNIYRKLAELHYKGTMAMEFYPTGDIVETLRRARDQARSILS